MGKMNDDERFRHVSYAHTDIRKTFARERRRLAEEERRRADAGKAVVPIGEKRRAAGGSKG